MALGQVNEDFESGAATGWVTSGTASTGTFVVANPTQETSTVITQPEDDNTPDPGVNAYFTATNTSAGNADVDGGTSITTSPTYFTANASRLSISYFFGQRDTGDDANDFFQLEYSTNGGTTYTNWVLIGDVQSVATWQDTTVDVPAGSNVVVRVTVSDGSGAGDIIEGGIDDFSIIPLVPTLIIDDYVIDEDAGTVDFLITTTLMAATGPFTAFYQTINGSATGGGVDYTDNTGSLNFSGALNESQTVTVSINDDSIVEFTENFQFQVTFTTDPTVDVSDFGNVTINDNDTVTISDGGTVNKCDGVFYDTGGIFGQYNTNEDITFTICPDSNGNVANINFTLFDVESFSDILRVYEGTSTAGTLIGSYHNSNLPPANITSTDASGCLTFRFTSNGSVNLNGWAGVISCTPSVSALTIDNLTVDEDAGTMIFNVEHTGLPTSGPFTVDYSITDVSTLASSDYTAAVSGTLNFDGTVGNMDSITLSINDDTLYEDNETFTIQFTGSSDLSVDITDIATGTINDNEVILNDQPLTLFEQFNGYYDYAVSGGTFRTQSNNTNACSISNTSSAVGLTSTVPATATIERAYLIWAHSNPTHDSQVTFQGQNVDAQLVTSFLHTSNRDFFGMVADVTGIIQAIPNLNTTTFTVANLTIDNSATYCDSSTVLGGWSLMVFYEELSLPAVTINYYNGFDGGADATSSFTLSGFYAIGSAGSKTTSLSWEGDATLANNESLQFITASSGTNTLSGDGGQTGTNPFNSTIFDNTVTPVLNNANIYGVDLDTYDVSSFLQQGENTATTTVNVGQDLVIMNSVLLKVPSNLITGTVFEDVNYGGGNGRDLTTSAGVPIAGATVELYDNLGNLFDSEITDVNGVYTFGGMADGSYSLRVVNGTVTSTRSGGTICGGCIPVQTYKANYALSTLNPVTTEVGGTNPSATDSGTGILTGAQSVSSITIASEGAVNMNFGFNFNTIVNTNDDGQGSLEQFIVNSNALDASGLDIEANSIFDPAPGDDTSIFMIPPTSDALGRTTDANYTSGYFDINIPNGNPLSPITGPNTVIDGRTQTAYSGDTNVGTVGAGGTAVGTSGTLLPNFELPEIQVHRNNGDVFQIQGDNDVIRNLAVFASQNTAILFDDGSGSTVSNSLLGVNALGVSAGDLSSAVEIEGTTVTNMFVSENYIAGTRNTGILVNGGTGPKTIQGNHVFGIGNGPCDVNVDIRNGGNGVLIQNNLIEDSQGIGIKSSGPGSVTILENTVTGSGQNVANCGPISDDFGISLNGDNSQIVNNIIYENGDAGLVLRGGTTSGNLISRNSFYNNGINVNALGIDLNEDGVSLNDSGDSDTGPNGLINFPIIEAAYKSGSNLVVSGWSRPGAIIEFFLTDVNQGTAMVGNNQLGMTVDYGEGQVFLASMVEGSGFDTNSGSTSYTDEDGNTDNTNKFTFTFPVAPGVVLGDDITATATISNSTSEFSPFSKLKAFTVITNRRTTYRVKKD